MKKSTPIIKSLILFNEFSGLFEDNCIILHVLTCSFRQVNCLKADRVNSPGVRPNRSCVGLSRHLTTRDFYGL